MGLVYVLGRARLGTGARLTLQCAAVSGMLLVGWARIVLRAHWPTDVLGGLLLGAACAAAVAWWDSSREAEATRRPAEDERPMARAGLARS